MDTQDQKTVLKIRSYTITIDRALCIGAATCIALAPHAYTLDSEAKAVFLPTAAEETDESLLDAAKGCPVMAITIKDDTGKQIFP
ncbi:MAG: ferredoxin [Candidatus Gottesmanbacteria bacterium]